MMGRTCAGILCVLFSSPSASALLVGTLSSAKEIGNRNRLRSPLRAAVIRASAETAVVDVLSDSEATPEVPSLFPQWGIPLSGKRNLTEAIEAFGQATVTVPLRASSEPGEGWRAWLDGGYATHRFINAKLSRTSYVEVLSLLLHMMVEIQARYKDLYAVAKFVPKKNGLNPVLAALQDGASPESMRIDHLKPREVRRRLDDVGRALSQTWLLLSCYLTLPSKVERDDFLWSARTVVEKVKTDQRARALELLCLGFFLRSSPLYPLVTATL